MSVFELTLIALIFLIGASSTISVGISPMPSSRKAREAMMQLLATVGTEVEKTPIVDLGSGWGSLIIRLAIKYPGRQVVGYELSIMPWLVTVLTSKLLGLKNITVYRQDFLTVDLSADAIIVCYLFPAAMEALDVKLAGQKTAIQYLISNNFALPSLQAEKTIRLDDFYRSPVYRYHLVDEGNGG